MSKRHCLIVDDSDVIRRVLRQILCKLQLDVSEAADGADALNQCRRSMPDAILLDWLMPGASGIETLQTLRRIPGGDRPVVIYCLTEYDTEIVARAHAAGADDVLLKPFTRVELQKSLTAAGLI